MSFHLCRFSFYIIEVRSYTTIIYPVTANGAETWILKYTDEHHPGKIICMMYGMIFENGNWRMRSNLKVEKLIENEDIGFLKSMRTKRLSHVERMTD